MFSKIKQFLPGSSRSLHTMHEDLNRAQEELHRLYERIEVADRGINMNLNYKYQLLSDDLQAHDSHMKMFAWEQYRHEDESIDDAKKRFFSSLPSATGGMRLLQIGCAKLFQEFDSLCKENDLTYWMNFGTLLGAIRHKGFIPWDDDVDLGMMREDIEKLIEIIDKDDRYRITIVFDKFVYCRQVRFLYSDETLPCFLDLFIYDWTADLNKSTIEKQRFIRDSLISRIKSSPWDAQWGERPYCTPSEPAYQFIKSEFDHAVKEARKAGLLCSAQDAKGIVWGLDNLDNSEQKRTYFSMSEIFPTASAPFEKMLFEAPQDAHTVLSIQYGDYFELPRDINSHFQHVSHDDLDEPDVAAALNNLIQHK